ncbi:MAG: hypothetical protein OEZ57_14355, partial [Nitrospirota bacterium]|nr:hypothetical protein [Nitrospirota bacterium]
TPNLLATANDYIELNVQGEKLITQTNWPVVARYTRRRAIDCVAGFVARPCFSRHRGRQRYASNNNCLLGYY